MSETPQTYIACAADNNAHTDVLVFRRGDLVHLLGHPHMEFTSADAVKLARFILDLVESGSAGDPLVDKICGEFQSRSRLGQKKYGATMVRPDLSLCDWLQHLKQELMDSILYGEAALLQLRDCEDDGK